MKDKHNWRKLAFFLEKKYSSWKSEVLVEASFGMVMLFFGLKKEYLSNSFQITSEKETNFDNT